MEADLGHIRHKLKGSSSTIVNSNNSNRSNSGDKGGQLQEADPMLQAVSAALFNYCP